VEKVKAFNKSAICDNGVSVREYKFQDKTVYVLSDGPCYADSGAEVIDSECRHIGSLGGNPRSPHGCGRFGLRKERYLHHTERYMAYSTSRLQEKYGFEYPFKPDPLAKKALRYHKSGKCLLDVGCGEGADTVFYAGKGYRVTAMDNNETYLTRLRAFVRDHDLPNLATHFSDVVNYPYPRNAYDVVSCLLVGCCMKRSEFEKMLNSLKQTVKPGGIIVMSLRNYLDADFKAYWATEKMIEPNTFLKKEDCCKIKYFIEKDRLREVFNDFEVLYYYEGYAPDKYEEVLAHGDSCIIGRRRMPPVRQGNR
jgi:SAM-dependent methyltransferase